MMAPRHILQRAFGRALWLVLGLALAACDAIDPPVEPGAALSANVTAPGHRPAVPAHATYRLRAGDTISVFVFDNPDLSQSVVVAPDGRISYPLAGTFRAEGRTLTQTRNILASRFSSNIVSPQVSVSLASIGAYTVYVNGEVLQPGALALQGPITLVQAITQAGGFTAFARTDRILIYNPTVAGGARRLFDYDAFVADPAQQDVLLRAGDTIIVL